MDMEEGKLIRDLPKGLISWYEFQKRGKALFISGGKPECEVLFDVLREQSLEVEKAKETELESLNGRKGTFDYIVGAGIIERSPEPERLLMSLKELLSPFGILLIGAENRLGLCHFCGEKDPFTGHVLDGLDNYSKVSSQRMEAVGGRAYSKAEYERMMRNAGYGTHRVYSVFPVLERPQILISKDYLPNESMDVRVFPQYKSPETLFLEEERMYAALIENQMFHQMANGFLIEASMEGELSDWDQITVQEDRGRTEALATEIKSQAEVSKKALYPEGQHKIEQLFENTEYLKQHGVPMAEGDLKDENFVMPYIEGQIGTEYFRDLLRRLTIKSQV